MTPRMHREGRTASAPPHTQTHTSLQNRALSTNNHVHRKTLISEDKVPAVMTAGCCLLLPQPALLSLLHLKRWIDCFPTTVTRRVQVGVFDESSGMFRAGHASASKRHIHRWLVGRWGGDDPCNNLATLVFFGKRKQTIRDRCVWGGKGALSARLGELGAPTVFGDAQREMHVDGNRGGQ